METLHLHIGAKKDDGWPLTLSSDADGEADVTALLPETEVSTEDTIDGRPVSLDRCSAVMQDENWRNEKTQKAYGSWLFRLIARDAVGDRLREKLGTESALLLRIDDEDLQQLPWEMLYDADSFTYYLGRSLTNPCLLSSGNLKQDELMLTWPLRILVVVGCGEGDGPGIDWERELAEIRRAALHMGPRAQLHVLPQPSRGEIKSAMAEIDPHVFHFIGHGTSGTEGALVLSGKRWPLNEISDDIQRCKPAIVVLNACQSAEQSRSTQSVAKFFLGRGSRAVIGMLGRIDGRAAATFATTFYQELAKGGVSDVCAAVIEGRIAMTGLSDNTPVGAKDWCLVRLQTAVAPKSILPMRPTTPPPPGHEVWDGKEPFLNRLVQRADILHPGLWRLPGQGTPLVIRGSDFTGVTSLIRFVLRAAHLNGHSVQYIDSSVASVGFDLFDLLDRIADGQGLVGHEMPDVEEAFEPFRTKRKGMTDGGPPVELNGLNEGTENVVEELTNTFWSCLEKLVGSRRHFLAIDPVRNERCSFREGPTWDQIKAFLKSAAAPNRSRMLQIVVGASVTDWRDWGLNELDNSDREPVGLLSAGEFPELCREFLHFHSEDLERARSLTEDYRDTETFSTDWVLQDLLGLKVVARKK